MIRRTHDAPGSIDGWTPPDASGRPLPVFINGRFLAQKTEGVQRAAEAIVRALDALMSVGATNPGRPPVTVLVPPDALRSLPLRYIAVRPVGRLRGHAWEQLELPWHARSGALLSLCNAAPVAKSRHVATLYDAAVFAASQGYSRVFATWYRFLFSSLGRTARRVLTSSEFSARELTRHAGIPRHKLRVVPLGAQHLVPVQPDDSVLDQHGLRGKPYVLAVGSLNPNKNLRSLLEAMDHMPAPRPRLVVAGGANAPVFRGGGGPTSLEGAIHVGYVSDRQLKSLYVNAAAFAFPSLYEGFGFPPLEAMTCGCPAVVSDIPVLREVCGDAAAYFDPRDPRDIARALHEVVIDRDRARALRSRGECRVQRFTWERCARAVWAEVEAVAEGRANSP